jgi:hypothetical protein
MREPGQRTDDYNNIGRFLFSACISHRTASFNISSRIILHNTRGLRIMPAFVGRLPTNATRRHFSI